MEPLLRWLEENVERDLTLDDIALHAGTSTRTLNRRFREQTGTTPLQWLHRARVRRAQYLLESTDHTVDRIATQAGFGSPTAFRDRFKRVVGTSPYAYRRAFRGSEDPCSSAAEPSSGVRSVTSRGSAAWARATLQDRAHPAPPGRTGPLPFRSATTQEASATTPATPNTAGQAPTFFASGCDPANAAT